MEKNKNFIKIITGNKKMYRVVLKKSYNVNVIFCNDKYQNAGTKNFMLEKVIVKKGASIGANATILPGVTIGENALIAAGSIVTKDVGDNEKYISMRKL